MSITCPNSDLPVQDKDTYWKFPGFPGVYCNKLLAGRMMDAKEYVQILSGQSPLLHGFKSKSGKGKSFSAKLRFEESKRGFEFEFPPQCPTTTLCPKSGQPVDDRGKYYYFPGFPKTRCWKEISRRKMQPEDYVLVFDAHPSPVEFHDFVSAKGRPFSAHLLHDTKKNKVVFDFPDSNDEEESEDFSPDEAEHV